MKASCVMVLVSAICASGCGLFSGVTTKTVAEEQSGYTYIPLDPFPAKESRFNCPSPPSPMFGLRLASVAEVLPDNTARISVVELSQSGDIKFTAGGVAEKGKMYKVTIDYTNSTTVQLPFWIKKTAKLYDHESKKVSDDPVPIDPSEPAVGNYAIGSARYDVLRAEPTAPHHYKKYNIPIYVGVGLRVISQIKTLEGEVNISGLGAISAEAEANHLAGSLVVQTLGINGKSVSAAIPIHSELNRTTVQASIVAISTIKTQLYSPDAHVQPRVVGMYLPLPADQKLINAVISALNDGSGESITFNRPCVPTDSAADLAARGPTFIPATEQ